MAKPNPRGIKSEFVFCRAWQHAWTPTDVTRDGNVYVQHMDCMRCPTKRRIRINKFDGTIEGNGYTYPDGYLVEGGSLTRQERGALRLNARST